jgi:hypothetical protein
MCNTKALITDVQRSLLERYDVLQEDLQIRQSRSGMPDRLHTQPRDTMCLTHPLAPAQEHRYNALAKSASLPPSDYTLPLPRRLFTALPTQKGFAFCDYLQPREELQDSLAALQDTLDIAFPVGTLACESVFESTEEFASSMLAER